MLKFGHNLQDPQFQPLVYLIDFFHKNRFFLRPWMSDVNRKCH